MYKQHLVGLTRLWLKTPVECKDDMNLLLREYRHSPKHTAEFRAACATVLNQTKGDNNENVSV